jgi:formylglycine-generating enzyme required for sulfatase activity
MAPGKRSVSPAPGAPLQLLRWRGRTQVFVERIDGLELPMVRIPAGSFWMGSPEGEEGRSEAEGPVHEVQLGEFLLGRTPITQEQWRMVAAWEPKEGERWGRKLQPHPSRFDSWEASAPVNRTFLSYSPELLSTPDRNRCHVKAAERAIAALGFVQAESEYPMAGLKPAMASSDLIARCGLFVGLYGLRYGDRVADRPELSTAELEFDLATERGLPRLIFVLDLESSELGLPAKALVDAEEGERQRAFLQRLQASGVMIQRFRNPDHLAALLLEALKPYGALADPNRLRPVECVSWEDAMEFCSRLSQRTGRIYTLPSEAQWEYACRAGTTTPFAFGETLTDEQANYRASETYGKGPKGAYRKQTTPVGMFPANGWGLQDMHGNVWEWCLDQWHGSYKDAPEDGSAWLLEEGKQRLLRGIEGREEERGTDAKERAGGGGRRLLRGGSWDLLPGSCRSAFRLHARPDDADDSIGFRVVCLPQGPSLNA